MVFIFKNKAVEIKSVNETINMKIESNVFENNKMIPTQYTCYGEGSQIPISISGVPENAKNLALIVDDPDAPNGEFVHWVIWNIPPETLTIVDNDLSQAVEGYTSLDKPGFVAPCPPSGIHHYNFNLYALDSTLSIVKSSDKADLIKAMERHIVDRATLVGLYGRE